MKYQTERMCDEGMKAYDSYIKEGNTPQQANKLASKVCNELKARGTKVKDLPEGRIAPYDKTIFDYFKKKKK